MLTIKLGDLLKEAQNFDAIMHGCNCFHEGDSGIAGQLWARYPKAHKGKLENHESGDFNVLGTFSTHKITEECFKLSWTEQDLWKTHEFKNLKKPFTVINAYTQYKGGSDFYLSALEVILKQMNESFAGKSIGIPKIGCGIGGGNWEQVELALLKYAPTINWTVIVWSEI